MVPLLVTACACQAVVAISRVPANIKRRFLFISHPPEDVAIRLLYFIDTVQDVSPTEQSREGVTENLVDGYRFNHSCQGRCNFCRIDKLVNEKTIS
jgi:hypothetical protein